MKRKVRKFQEGGFTPEQEAWLGGADRTDPYILARMRKAVPDKVITKTTEVGDDSPAGKSGYGEQNELPEVATVKKTVTSVAVPKAPAKTTPAPTRSQEETDRLAALEKKQALIDVSPEDYIPGVGMVKGLLKKGLKRLVKPGMKTYTPAEFEAMTPKLGRENLKLGMKKGGAVKKMASGGKVSSASKRADGCAIKGKTRGRMV
jgi:hypothetical protein